MAAEFSSLPQAPAYSSLYQFSKNAEVIPLANADAIKINDRMDSRPIPESPLPLQS